MDIKEAMDLLELLRRIGYKGRIEQAHKTCSYDEKKNSGCGGALEVEIIYDRSK